MRRSLCRSSRRRAHRLTGGPASLNWVRVLPISSGPDHSRSCARRRSQLSRLRWYAWGAPITATSANKSGDPPATTAEQLASLKSPALFIIDAGPTPGGSPSTIVDARGAARPILLREGAIAWGDVLHSLKG